MPDQAASEPLTNPSLSSIAATAKTEGVKVDAELDASKKRQKDTLDTMLAQPAPEPKDYQVDKPTPPPPAPPQTDPFHAFGSPASWVAAFGSLLSRRPLITALNSATAVMHAAKENDQEAFKRHHEIWKENSEYAKQVADWQMNRYEMAFDKYKNDQDKLRSTLTVLASQDQNTLMRQAAHSDNAMTMWNAFEDQKNKSKEFNLRHEELAARIQQHEDAMQQHRDQMQAMGWDVLTDPATQKQYRYNKRTGQATDLQGQPYEPSGAAKMAAAKDPNAAIDDETARDMARQYLAGDTSVKQNVGRGAQGADNLAKVNKMIYEEAKKQGLQPEAIAAKIAEFQGIKAGERTLGTRTAQIGMAINETKMFAPLALQASEKVDRSRFPSLNSLMLAAERGTGDENVVRLAVATNSFLNAYARGVTPTGVPTEGAQSRARELLDAAWSKGQFKAALDQLGLELNAAAKSPGQTREEFRDAVTGGKSPVSEAAQPQGGGPSLGTVEDGHRFKGGDPSQESSWEKVQ